MFNLTHQSSIPESSKMIIKDSSIKTGKIIQDFQGLHRKAGKSKKKLSLGQGSFLQVFFSQEPALQCNKKNSKCILLYKKMSWYVSAVPGHDLISCLMFAFHLGTGHFYHQSPDQFLLFLFMLSRIQNLSLLGLDTFRGPQKQEKKIIMTQPFLGQKIKWGVILYERN